MVEGSERSQGAKAERQKRLAEALRANLKRRKAQSRKRPADPGEGSENRK